MLLVVVVHCYERFDDRSVDDRGTLLDRDREKDGLDSSILVKNAIHSEVLGIAQSIARSLP